MSDITQIEDALISAITALGFFKVVDSVGRKDLPESLNFPSAQVYFAGADDTGSLPRPQYDLEFHAVVGIKNLRGEKAAARDTYSILETVRDGINGKQFGLTDIAPFVCKKIQIIDYAGGVISYLMVLGTDHILPVPSPS